MRSSTRFFSLLVNLAASLLIIWLLYAAGNAFYAISWGTGKWLGEFSLRWGLTFFAFVLAELGMLGLTLLGLWFPQRLEGARRRLLQIRQWLGWGRWALAFLLVALLIWFFQYTPWGAVFVAPSLRLLAWLCQLTLLAFLFSPAERLLSFSALVTSAIVSGFTFAFAANLRLVTDFPFTLGWSEGNRLWDYSMLFGADRYILAPGQQTFVHLSLGRQLVGGLPFLYRDLTIAQARAWIGLTYLLPYILLGWATFWKARPRPWSRWALAGLWGVLFLLQGPIHPPLVFAAFLTVLAWGSSLWVGVPLLVVAGYFAVISRYTWVFAPAMWIGMLEWVSDAWESGRLSREGWKRVIALVSAGLFGSVLLSNLIPVSSDGGGGFSLRFTNQPLLWYRLLPNATYGPGIILALLVATAPLIGLLLYRAGRREWPLHFWQKLAILAPLLAFLVVGLIASTKIGGGGDLHNLDMFFIGLLFTTALAWRVQDFLFEPQRDRLALMLLLITLLLPSLMPLQRLYPLSFADAVPTVLRLRDIEIDPKLEPDRAARALGSLPRSERVREGLQTLRQALAALSPGEVLFMDQRQLLTFGYIRVPLVVEYEKKRMMDKAMADDAAYFQKFYADLAAHRFALIVSDPLRDPIKDVTYAFGEENNAWVKWVSRPLLCYYQPMATFEDLRLQLLLPNPSATDCTDSLPAEIHNAP